MAKSKLSLSSPLFHGEQCLFMSRPQRRVHRFVTLPAPSAGTHDICDGHRCLKARECFSALPLSTK
jgi:hypothetical protein